MSLTKKKMNEIIIQKF